MVIIEQNLLERAKNERLTTLLTYLASDPENETLKIEAAEHALASGEPAIARDLMAAGPSQLGDRELNLLGLADMQLGNFADAGKSFEALISRGVEAPAVQFNLAWSLAMQKDLQGSLALLTEEVTSSVAQAAMLEVQLLHEQGQFEKAAEVARRHLRAHPNDQGLAAAVSVLALDVEDLELARACGIKGGEHPDAQVTLGTLALGEQHIDEAIEYFDRAIEANAGVPRAWLGRGMAKLLAGNTAEARSDMDRGAELFEDHIGSWVAAGWAYLLAGDLGPSRERFDRAMAIDENFGESHGSLAVLDVLEGNEEAAQKRIAVALRLDRASFSARLAQSLLLERGGDAPSSRALFNRILETPVNERGDTVSTAIARLGLK